MSQVARDPDAPAPRKRRPAARFGYRRANMQNVFVPYIADDQVEYSAAPQPRPAQNPRRGNGVSRRGRGGARAAAAAAAVTSRDSNDAKNSTGSPHQPPPNANLERPPRNGTLTSLNDQTSPYTTAPSSRRPSHFPAGQEATPNSLGTPAPRPQNLSIRLDTRGGDLLEEWLDARGAINGGNRLQAELAQARRESCLPFLNERPDLFNAFIVWIQLEDCEGRNLSPMLATSQIQVYVDECERSISHHMQHVSRENVNELAASIFVLMTCAFRTGDQAFARMNFDRLCNLVARFPSVAADVHLFKSLLLSWGYMFTAWHPKAMLSIIPDYLMLRDDFAVSEVAEMTRADMKQPSPEFRFIDLQRNGVIGLDSLEVALAIRKAWHSTHKAREVSSLSEESAAKFLGSLVATNVRLTQINVESTHRSTLEQAINLAQAIVWTHSQISSRRPAFEVLAAAIVHHIVNFENIHNILSQHSETVLWLLMLATPFQKQGQGTAIPEILSEIKTRLNIVDFAQVKEICKTYFWDADLNELAEITWHEAMQVAQPRTPNSFTDVKTTIARLKQSAQNRSDGRRPFEDRTFEFMRLAKILYTRNDEGMERNPRPASNGQPGEQDVPAPANSTVAELINLAAAFNPSFRN